MMKRLAMLGLGTVLGAALGALGLLTGQRSGFLSVPTSPGDPWENAPDAGRAISPTALPVTTDSADGTSPAGETDPAEGSGDTSTLARPDTADARTAPEAPMGAVSTAVPADEPSAPNAGQGSLTQQDADASSHTTETDEPVRYLTVGEVADLLGTTASALAKTADLPTPDVVVGRTRGWLESTIARHRSASDAH